MDKNLIKGDRKNGTIIKREWKHQPVERSILDFVDLTRSSFIETKKKRVWWDKVASSVEI